MRNSIDLIPSRQPFVTYITDALLGCNIWIRLGSTRCTLTVAPTGELEAHRGIKGTMENDPYEGIRGPRGN
jgi:hypothetical protein